MPKVVFLVGLCGSGKSRKGKQMEKSGFEWVGEGVGSNYAKYTKLVGLLKAGKNCVAEEFQCLAAHGRTQIETRLKADVGDPLLEVEFWFFEKSLHKASLNILSRPEKDIEIHLAINGRNYDKYVLPPVPHKLLEIEPPTPYKDEAGASSPRPLVIPLTTTLTSGETLITLIWPDSH